MTRGPPARIGNHRRESHAGTDGRFAASVGARISRATLAPIRRILHATIAVLSLTLLGTGFLIEFPDVRAWAIGGYGREVVRLHRWGGVLYVLAPLLALLLVARPLFLDFRHRVGGPDSSLGRKVVVGGSLPLWSLLVVTGALLWPGLRLSATLADLALGSHIALTWVLVVWLLLHLFRARRSIVAKVLHVFRRTPGRSATLVRPFDDENDIPSS